MSNFITQLVIGSDGKLKRKKKSSSGQASRPSRTRRLIKLITVIKRYQPEFNAHGFANQRVMMRPSKTSRQAWLDQMIKDLLMLKRDLVANAKLAGTKPQRFTNVEKKALRKDLMHFRAEILGKVSAPVAAGVAASHIDEGTWKRARKAARKQYPGLYKRNKSRFKAITKTIYQNMISAAVVAPVAAPAAVNDKIDPRNPKAVLLGVLGRLRNLTVALVGPEGNSWVLGTPFYDATEISDSGLFGIEIGEASIQTEPLGRISILPDSIEMILLPPYGEDEVTSIPRPVLEKNPAAILVTDTFESV